MTPRLAARVLVGAWVAAGATAGAQASREVRLEAGAAQLQQLNRDTRAAATLAASWRGTSPRLASLAAASAAWARDSIAALQGVGALVYRPGADSPWLTEGGVTAAAFGIANIGRGGNASVFLRQRVVFDGGGAWVGGAFGSSVRDEAVSHGTTVDAGAWYGWGPWQGTASVARHRTDDVPLFDAAGIYLTRFADAYDVHDATLTVHYTQGALTFEGSQVWRRGVAATAVAQSALMGSATWAFSKRYALAVTAGRQLADPVRGTPDARMLAAVLRVTWATARDDDEASGASSFVRIVPGEGGSTVYVHVTSPDSSLVTVAGSFSGWEPVQLRRVYDGWEAELFLKPGRYRIAVRVDNGPWRAPGNLAKMKDEYDGQNGLIIIP